MRKVWFVSALTLAAAFASAQNIDGLTFTGGTLGGDGNSYTVGWDFDVTTPVTVTGLGWYDTNSAGGTWTSALVQIWDRTTGGSIGSATVNSTGTLSNGFRYANKTPFVLAAGSYTIGGVGKSYIKNATSFSTAPGITYVRSVTSAQTTTAIRPTIASGYTNGAFGPTIRVQSVPEPASLCALGLGAIALIRRRRSK